MLKQHGSSLNLLSFILEIVAVIASWLVVLKLTTGMPLFFTKGITETTALEGAWPTTLLLALVWSFFFYKGKLMRASKRSRSFANLIFFVIKIHSSAFISFFALTYFLNVNGVATRGTFVIFYVVSSIALTLAMFAWYMPLRYYRKQGKNIRRVLIVGAGNLGLEILQKILADKWMGYRVVGFLDDKIDTGNIVNGFDILGKVEDISRIITEQYVDTVIIALPLRAYKKLDYIMQHAVDKFTNLYLAPDVFQFQLLNCGVSDLDGIPIVDMVSSKINGFQGFLKRVIDLSISLILLVIFSPVFALIAIFVKLSSNGPVFYRQKRMGLNGEVFDMFKFRSMYLHDPKIADERQATKTDPRITRTGRFLRYTSLDELPQLINVLLGQMSLIGPRPHSIKHNDIYKELIPAYLWRHKVKPGITGWAQANGWRGETDTLDKMEKRVEYDKYYIENWSFWLDLKIVGLTLVKGLKNAY